MNDPPDHTAEFSAANLLSLGGMIVPNQRLTMSGYSRMAVSMSQNNTPGLEVGPVAVEDDLGLVLGR